MKIAVDMLSETAADPHRVREWEKKFEQNTRGSDTSFKRGCYGTRRRGSSSRWKPRPSLSPSSSVLLKPQKMRVSANERAVFDVSETETVTENFSSYRNLVDIFSNCSLPCFSSSFFFNSRYFHGAVSFYFVCVCHFVALFQFVSIYDRHGIHTSVIPNLMWK